MTCDVSQDSDDDTMQVVAVRVSKGRDVPGKSVTGHPVVPLSLPEEKNSNSFF